jgi:hypothetical protein
LNRRLLELTRPDPSMVRSGNDQFAPRFVAAFTRATSNDSGAFRRLLNRFSGRNRCPNQIWQQFLSTFADTFPATSENRISQRASPAYLSAIRTQANHPPVVASPVRPLPPTSFSESLRFGLGAALATGVATMGRPVIPRSPSAAAVPTLRMPIIQRTLQGQPN